jgi:hypothetical protein
MSKVISLTQGYVTLVDDDDYIWLSQWRWHYGDGYARRNEWRGGKSHTIRMHRLIHQTPAGMDTDHIDGDGLNNQRSNLRTATSTENMRNRRMRKDNTSGFRGVTWSKREKKWVAQIRLDGKRIHLGYYNTPEEAAEVYIRKAIELFGEFFRPKRKPSDLVKKSRR